MNSKRPFPLASTLLALAGALHLAGCASIVMKPQDDTMRLQIAEDALATFSKELRYVGWAMLSSDAVVQSEEYRKAFMPSEINPDSRTAKLIGLMHLRHQSQFFSPSGMLPILFSDRQANTRYYGDAKRGDPTRVLATMAKQLNVDAVIVVQLDYCYKGGLFSVLGTGQALMTAASSLRAVNQNGELVVNMRDIPNCGGKTRATSDTSAAMHQGNLLFTRVSKDRFRRMFVEATRKSAERTVAVLAKAMQDGFVGVR